METKVILIGHSEPELRFEVDMRDNQAPLVITLKASGSAYLGTKHGTMGLSVQSLNELISILQTVKEAADREFQHGM